MAKQTKLPKPQKAKQKLDGRREELRQNIKKLNQRVTMIEKVEIKNEKGDIIKKGTDTVGYQTYTKLVNVHKNRAKQKNISGVMITSSNRFIESSVYINALTEQEVLRELSLVQKALTFEDLQKGKFRQKHRDEDLLKKLETQRRMKKGGFEVDEDFINDYYQAKENFKNIYDDWNSLPSVQRMKLAMELQDRNISLTQAFEDYYTENRDYYDNNDLKLERRTSILNFVKKLIYSVD